MNLLSRTVGIKIQTSCLDKLRDSFLEIDSTDLEVVKQFVPENMVRLGRE